jgi:hypothetical protein
LLGLKKGLTWSALCDCLASSETALASLSSDLEQESTYKVEIIINEFPSNMEIIFLKDFFTILLYDKKERSS